MKYKTKIVSEGSGYVGYVYSNSTNELIYKSPESNDPILISRAVSAYLAELTEGEITPKNVFPLTQPIVTTKPQPIINGGLSNVSAGTLPPAPSPTQPIYAPSRRCCGRG